jgi:hypothetical protein
MDYPSVPQAAAQYAIEPARTDGANLVIVVLNELACAGRPCVCGTSADYFGAMPVAA